MWWVLGILAIGGCVFALLKFLPIWVIIIIAIVVIICKIFS
jgi:hypothetical protein